MRVYHSIGLCIILLAITACGPASDYECPETKPNGSTPPGETPNTSHHGNGELWTALWPDGVVVFNEDGPGEIRPDGSLAMKFPWWRGEGVRGSIEVSGRRLDETGTGVIAEFPSGYGDTGFQASALVFPSEGCWVVTARSDEAELSFVTKVVRLE